MAHLSDDKRQIANLGQEILDLVFARAGTRNLAGHIMFEGPAVNIAFSALATVVSHLIESYPDPADRAKALQIFVGCLSKPETRTDIAPQMRH